MQNLTSIKDLLAQTLEEIVPFYIFRIGDLEFKCWKPEHISEEYNLRYLNCQAELIVLSQQYQALVNELNTIEDSSVNDVGRKVQTNKPTNELNAIENNSVNNVERKVRINKLTYEMNEIVKAMMPLNANYIEALTESNPNTLLKTIEAELKKKNLVKKIPLGFFINTIRQEINTALDKNTKKDTDEGKGDEGKEVTRDV